MESKPFMILLFTSFALMVVGAVVGNLLESSGTLSKDNLGLKGTAAVVGFFFVLFCLMAFSLVPLVIRVFVVLQGRIGNADVFLVKWIRDHERSVVYGVWGLFATGLVIIFLLARNEIIKQLK